jgi:fructokinase
MNEEEAATISRMFFGTVHSFRTLCLLLSEKYPEMSVICITKGPEGAAVYHEGIYEEIAATPVEVADTVGAGDAFAGILYYLSDTDIQSCTSRSLGRM